MLLLWRNIKREVSEEIGEMQRSILWLLSFLVHFRAAVAEFNFRYPSTSVSLSSHRSDDTVMALKWTLLFVAAFIATVSAVTDTSQDIPMPMPTSVMPDAMVPSTSSPVAPSPTPQPETPPSASEELQGRFDMSLAEDVRANHFYVSCYSYKIANIVCLLCSCTIE